MRVKAEVILKLFDLLDDSGADPRATYEAIERLSDNEVADLLGLYCDAAEEAGDEPVGLIKSAIRRLRKEPPNVES